MLTNDADAAHSTLQRRRRSGFAVQLLTVFLLGLAAVGCAGSGTAVRSDSGPVVAGAEGVNTEVDSPEVDSTEGVSAGAPEQPTAPVDVRQAEPQKSSVVDLEPSPSDPPGTPAGIVAADTELPPAPVGFDSLVEDEPIGPLPVAIAIENIGVEGAAVIAVGVNPQDLSFEVPPADQVGWYEFGPKPGQAGSAVLAAHIAYNGQDGVFRHLEDVDVGSIVVVSFDDGNSQRYRIADVTEYVKEELPDSLFARDGKEQLALITCGGAFNYQLDSYESNTVAIAVPIG